MNSHTLLSLITEGESQTLEFKNSTVEKSTTCLTLCAFANSQGGQLFFGVTLAGKLIGRKITDRTQEELAQEFQDFEPPSIPTIERILLDKVLEALLVQVRLTSVLRASCRGTPCERVLNTTRIIPSASYQHLLIESLHASTRWEIEPAEDLTVEQLNKQELLVTLEESIRRGHCEDPDSRDTKYPDFLQLKLLLAPFKGRTRNAFSLMCRAERFLLIWLPIAGRIEQGKLEQIDIPVPPIEAIREALANAFIHRDYTSGGGAIGVAIYDNRLEIIYPGNLHFGLTPETLFQSHESKPFNPLIANVFYRRGTLKIVELTTVASLPAPAIQNTQNNYVIMTFDLKKLRGDVNEGGNISLLSVIDRHPALAIELSTPPKNIQRRLKTLRDQGQIELRSTAKTGWHYVCA